MKKMAFKRNIVKEKKCLLLIKKRKILVISLFLVGIISLGIIFYLIMSNPKEKNKVVQEVNNTVETVDKKTTEKNTKESSSEAGTDSSESTSGFTNSEGGTKLSSLASEEKSSTTTEKKQNSSSTSKNTSSNTTGGATTSEAPTTSESTEYVPTAWSPSAEEIVQAVKDKAASLGKPDAYTYFYNRFNEALQESFLEPKRINLGGKIYYDPQTPLDEMWAEEDHGMSGVLIIEYPPYSQDANKLRETPEDIKNDILNEVERKLQYLNAYWIEYYIDSDGCYCFKLWFVP